MNIDRIAAAARDNADIARAEAAALASARRLVAYHDANPSLPVRFPNVLAAARARVAAAN